MNDKQFNFALGDKMSVFKKIIAAALSISIILCCLCSCGESYKDAYIYFELLEQPKTLDPQTASSDAELLIVRNIYEGLLRKNSDGEIVNAACDSYSYSDLTYTFKLKKNLVWSDGTPLTAHDFVYGLRRAVDPKIKSPFASRLFSVSGAEKISSGKAKPSSLGVKAQDDYTLTIKMCRQDKSFLETLTTSVCMPCNENFFENSIGKYGLDAECIISNGSYRLTKWNKEDFGIRLYKNEEYSGEFKAQNGAVFISCIEEESQTTRLSDGDSDMAFLPCEELETAKKLGYTNKQLENICWILTISNNYSAQVRKAFALSFSTDVYSSALPQGFAAADSIYPEILGIDAAGEGILQYDMEKSKEIMSQQISAMEGSKFPQSVLYYYDTVGVKALTTAIVGHWQQNLSTFINIQDSENLSALQKEISQGELDFALFPIKATSERFDEYAANFIAENDEKVPKKFQKKLLSGNKIIPVAFQSTNICYIPTLENVSVEESNGYIDFSYIVKR